MEGIYPSLHEKFKNEGICPICMMAMGLSPKYSCQNDHAICHRCKPYYYACPTCGSPLNIHIPPAEVGGYHMPPPMHYMPHPYPPINPQGNVPSAPFIDQERYSWAPPTPTEDQELKHCGFCHAGCEARFPEHLRQVHESRCQFRPNLEDEQLSTDLSCDEETLHNCRYRIAGCNVRLAEWRKRIHEDICIYKDKYEEMNDGRGSPNQYSHEDQELKHCGFCHAGCTARFVEELRQIHESSCEFRPNFEEERSNEYSDDEGALENCRYTVAGCNVRLPEWRKKVHEDICIYKDKYEEMNDGRGSPNQYSHEDQELKHCGFCHAGCTARFVEELRQVHESSCEFRPNFEEERSNEYSDGEGALENCRYTVAGCNVRLPEWRKKVHEDICIYKDKFEALDGIRDSLDDPSFGDQELKHCGFCHAGCCARFPEHMRENHESSCEFRPDAGVDEIRNNLDDFTFVDDHGSCDGDSEELVDCPFRRYGCTVRMPRRRRNGHRDKCNYREHYNPDDYENCEPEMDPDTPVACPWAVHGCQVMPRYCRLNNHAEKCNYRMEECSYKDHGCDATFQPARKFAHEKFCSYAY